MCPKRPWDRDPSDIGRFDGGDTEEDTSIFTEEDAKPQRNFRPFDEISPISSTPVSNSSHHTPHGQQATAPAPPKKGSPAEEGEKGGDDDRYDPAAPLEDKGGEM